eukprot:CAMPEP_0172808446 /NCGR_PEP_ID=MMETSP1075-20121228/7697_1 /TAXON_ID=2916 /ORGANISM="Ceratium fusus, Strain PA161109" /LENGTH=67 /DNA_ID=CAMNT_0013647603 /DNA_START=69 /DNA_END=269 /DNA_ORIENTATION=+
MVVITTSQTSNDAEENGSHGRGFCELAPECTMDALCAVAQKLETVSCVESDPKLCNHTGHVHDCKVE